MNASQTDEASRAVLASGKRAQVRAHVSHAATCGKRVPLILGWISQRVLSIEVCVAAPDRLAVSLDQLVRVELGVDHDRVNRGVAEQRLDDVDRRVVVEMLGCEQASTVMRTHDQPRAVALACLLSTSVEI